MTKATYTGRLTVNRKKFDEDIQELLQYSYLSSTDGDTRRNSRRKQHGTYSGTVTN